MNKTDFYKLLTFLLENDIQFELKFVANADGDIKPSLLVYEQDIDDIEI